MPKLLLSRPLARQVIGLLTMCGCIIAFASQAFAQKPTPQLPNSLVNAPRELSQQLVRARQAFGDGKVAEGYTALRDLHEALNGQGDYFLKRTDETPPQTLHRAVRELTNAGHKKCQELFGAHARVLLDEAIRDRDRKKLFAVANSWFPVEATNQAKLLVARIHLDESRPLLAARVLERLAAFRHAGQFEPELSMLLAMSYLQTDRRDSARKVLDELRTTCAEATAQIGDSHVRLFGGESKAVDLLSKFVAVQPIPKQQVHD